MIFLKIAFVVRSTIEMLLEFEFCTYITPAEESAVKLLPDEAKALIPGNKVYACSKVELLTIGTATAAAATIVNIIIQIASINVRTSFIRNCHRSTSTLWP